MGPTAWLSGSSPAQAGIVAVGGTATERNTKAAMESTSEDTVAMPSLCSVRVARMGDTIPEMRVFWRPEQLTSHRILPARPGTGTPLYYAALPAVVHRKGLRSYLNAL